MSRMKDRQEQVERIANLLEPVIHPGADVKKVAAVLVRMGIGDKDRFEVYRKWKGYGALMGDKICGIKPIDYKENDNERD